MGGEISLGLISSRKLSGGCGQAREHSWNARSAIALWQVCVLKVSKSWFGSSCLALIHYLCPYTWSIGGVSVLGVALWHMLCSFVSLLTSSVTFESFTPFHTDSQPVHDLCEVPSFQRAHSWENSPCSYQSVRLLRARFVPVSLRSLLALELQAGGSAVISPPCCSF